ncbi:MAG: carbamoyltransferase N-terminal domain-containing protein, partial [Planctomycetota bacterium]|nr:carbamoyltransferase N-terminal domain-containing protein [Planctomycetota bacterium]
RWRHHAEFLTAVPNYLLGLIPGRPGERVVDHVKQEFVLEEGFDSRSIDIYYLDHHLCHAASCFYVSPFEEAAILTMDGYGERTSTLMAKGRGTEIHELKRIDFPDSLGAFYASLTQYLGFRANYDEGKVMALAAFGDDSLQTQMSSLFDLNEDGSFTVDRRFFGYYMQGSNRYSADFVCRFGGPRKHGDEICQRHKDVAAAGQKVMENCIVHMARWLQRQTGLKRLCLAGGVALNSVANARILAETDFEEVFIQPAAGDDGASIGAALYLHHGIKYQERSFILEHPYWGPEYSDSEIQSLLSQAKLKSFSKPDNLSCTVAGLLADGKFVGWFQGRMEIGPRALGARSILADPRSAMSRDQLNAEVKHRESFRPFAPAV